MFSTEDVENPRALVALTKTLTGKFFFFHPCIHLSPSQLTTASCDSRAHSGIGPPLLIYPALNHLPE